MVRELKPIRLAFLFLLFLSGTAPLPAQAPAAQPLFIGETLRFTMTIMGVTNHTGWEIFPRFVHGGPLGAWLITARHHQRHHQFYGCNYGLYFRFWDRLCGTDKGLGDFARTTPR